LRSVTPQTHRRHRRHRLPRRNSRTRGSSARRLVPINRDAIFFVVLFLIQSMEHTTLYFSADCAAFIMIAAFAFPA